MMRTYCVLWTATAMMSNALFAANAFVFHHAYYPYLYQSKGIKVNLPGRTTRGGMQQRLYQRLYSSNSNSDSDDFLPQNWSSSKANEGLLPNNNNNNNNDSNDQNNHNSVMQEYLKEKLLRLLQQTQQLQHLKAENSRHFLTCSIMEVVHKLEDYQCCPTPDVQVPFQMQGTWELLWAHQDIHRDSQVHALEALLCWLK